MFVGTYQHPPNEDAAIFLAKSIWPLIRPRLPADARCLLAGSSVTPAVAALAGDGVEVLGFVPDLDPLLDSCRVSVAPLRYGAGIKGKIASALQAGLPTVATSMAVEGTGLRDGVEVLVADTATEFAEAVVRLYNDISLWQSLSKEGCTFVKREYSLDANRVRVRQLLDGLELEITR